MLSGHLPFADIFKSNSRFPQITDFAVIWNILSKIINDLYFDSRKTTLKSQCQSIRHSKE